MKNIREIKKHLRKEDYRNLSLLTGYSQEYIENCIHHRRNNLLIVQAANQLLAEPLRMAYAG